MKRRNLLSLLLLLPTLASCEPEKAMPADAKNPAPMPKIPEGAETITLGAGCFWCIEAAFRRFEGVYSATSGYMGGTMANPTYEQVCDGSTGHAEVVQVVFDPKKITPEKVLTWFWDLHDPTTLNRQGADSGTQYRSAIFYHTDAQKTLAEASKKAAQANFKDPIVTEITKAGTFYPAENYHQDYYFQNKSNGYCRMVIEPKLKKLKLDH
ncbi:peptide-methionine (S)-S-oxide reductase MsrA [Luteolibacter sp. Populi]|uniref:peptide-methionine (S)-S-oxide reductase MsrA n=1 Tax=Luteolibacter sp. Populi TaxID=3230487 RepID=UPI003467B158